MDKNVYEILNELENLGYEAYVVGGYVRDYLLGTKSYDVDICTNALPKDIIKIFKNCSNNGYGSFRLTKNNYIFDITTYRMEKEYVNRRPTKIEYTNNLLLDIKRRDFTMNTIIMNKKGTIIDLMEGVKDIQNKKIKCIGNIDQKLKEDPLRILRAIRFAITLDFSIDKELLKAIKKNKNLIQTLSYQRKKSELDKILASPKVLKGLNLLKDLDVLKLLEIHVNDIVVVDDLAGMYAQIDLSPKYPITKSDKNNIENIKKIVKYGKIDNYILYNYGLYLSSVAGLILGYNRLEIAKEYEKLPIKNIKDIDINAQIIMEELNIPPSKTLKKIMNDIKNAILEGNVKNELCYIKDYILQNKGRWLNE